MFKENRERLQESLISQGFVLTNAVLILNNSFCLPKNDDDCEHFPTKFDPYITWLTGIFYTDINIMLHLDTLEMTAFYPNPSEVDRCFIKFYDQAELAKFGVTELIYEDQLVQKLKDNNTSKVYFIRGKTSFESISQICLLII